MAAATALITVVAVESGTISGYADCYDLINYAFELIEEPEEIDIQGIEEIPQQGCLGDARDYRINQLIGAVKQLDRKIKEDK